MTRGLYQGWIGHRNLGDEAIFQACARCLPRIRWTQLPFDENGRRFDVRTLRNRWTRGVAKLLPGWLGILGGGTVINQSPHWLEQYRLLRRTVGRPVPVLSPGVADPSFWAGVDGWRDTRAAWAEELLDLPEIGVRGPASKRLLDEAGVRNVIVTGDPALAFYEPGRVATSTTRRTVAVNAGRTGGRMWGSEDVVITKMTEVVVSLARGGMQVRLFPMWHGDDAVCREIARAARLDAGAVDPLVLDAGRFVHRLREFDVVVSMKLHGSVLAAAAGVPFVAIEHLPKVRDFVDSIDWGRFTFRSDTFHARDVVDAVREMQQHLPALRDQLGTRVAAVAESFRGYARRVEAYLLAS